MSLPPAFCWSRVGTEAGQSLDTILRRKECERLANGGLFFWGVGNAIGPSLRELVKQCRAPEVIFTPIKSAPRQKDVRPKEVVRWTRAVGLDGRTFELPPGAVITSRFDRASPKPAHYALVCVSEVALDHVPEEPGSLEHDEVENLLTGRPVGASQVTAVVRRKPCANRVRKRTYRVSLRARLAPPFFLRLTVPATLAGEEDLGSSTRFSAIFSAWAAAG